MSSISPVLIVGAGPSGSVLALTLLKNGIPVRIIDKSGPQIGQKGLGMQPRSLEMHHFLGTLPDIIEVAKRPPYCNIYKLGGTEPLKTFELDPYENPTSDCPYINSLILGQQRQQSILHNHLEKHRCQVEFKTEMRSFEQFQNHVSVVLVTQDPKGTEIVETVNVPFLVGTDGAHSVTRKALGMTFLGDTRHDVDMVVGDIEIKGGLDPKSWHVWGESSTKLVSLLPTEIENNIFTFTLSGMDIDHAKTASGREELIKTITSITNRTEMEFGELVWISHYRPNIRMVSKFSEGRVFIAGDAAHVHSPTGGQGSNSSVQDSFNLGWKLALVLKGVSPLSLLDTYTEERLPVIAAMLQKSTLLLNRGMARSRGDGSNWVRGKEIKQLGVNYRGGSIFVDETTYQDLLHDSYSLASDGEVHAGDRAPEAPGLYDVHGKLTTSLFDIFGPDHHTVLVFGSTVEGTNALSELGSNIKDFFKTILIFPATGDWETPQTHVDLVLRDRDGHAYDTYPILPTGYTIVVVRPDGVVGAIVGNPDGLRKYIEGIFITTR